MSGPSAASAGEGSGAGPRGVGRAGEGEVAIGEGEDGQVVHVDLRTFPFLRIHGATQSGKTALAELLVAQAIHHGYEVDIYDNRQGKDWGVFAGSFQIRVLLSSAGTWNLSMICFMPLRLSTSTVVKLNPALDNKLPTSEKSTNGPT